MNALRTRRLSPAFVVALDALFVALGGTASAVSAQAVPLAKRALVADNEKKVGGQPLAQLSGLVGLPRPRRRLRGREHGGEPDLGQGGTLALSADAQGSFTATCDAGQKAIAGGYANPVGTAVSLDTARRPRIRLVDLRHRSYRIGLGGRCGAGDLPEIASSANPQQPLLNARSYLLFIRTWL